MLVYQNISIIIYNNKHALPFFYMYLAITKNETSLDVTSLFVRTPKKIIGRMFQQKLDSKFDMNYMMANFKSVYGSFKHSLTNCPFTTMMFLKTKIVRGNR